MDIAVLVSLSILIKFWLEILKGRDNLADLGIDGKIILK
jgi:hypothetical protein